MVLLNYFNNTGGINRYSSISSLNESEKHTDWYDAQNVEGHKSGGITKMKGNVNICNSSLPVGTKILGIWDYRKGDTSYPVVNTSEGKLYRFNIDTGILSEVYSGFNADAKCSYVNYNNGVIISNGINSPVFYEEGVGASLLAGTPPVGQAMEVHKARIFIGSGSTLHYCALGNHNDWTTQDEAGYISNFHNDSSKIIALKNYGEYLAIYKEQGIYFLSGATPSEFVITPVADKGIKSTWCTATVNNNQYFFTGEAILPIKFNELGQIRLSEEISTKIKPVFAELDASRFHNAFCVDYEKKNQIWFYLPTENSSDLDICYIYDYLHGAWYKRVGIPVISGTVINGVIYTGTSDGRILKEDFGDNFDGNCIEAWWYSPWFSFGKSGIPKEISSFNIWIYQNQNYPIEFLYSKDYDTLNYEQNTVNVYDGNFLIWNTGELDEDIWVSQRPVKKKIQIDGQFEALQIGFKNIQKDQPFTVVGYSFEVDTGQL